MSDEWMPKVAFGVGICVVSFAMLYEPLPNKVADRTKLWFLAKTRKLVRYINRFRKRREFQCDLMELFSGMLPQRFDAEMTIEDVISGEDSNKIHLRVYRPASRPPKGPCMIYVHGGGYTFGSVYSYDYTCYLWAKKLGFTVASVQYRKAPQHIFPRQIADVEAAVNFVVSKADEWDIDVNRIGLMGDSAGGCLTAVVSMKMRPANDRAKHPIAMQVLLCPALQSLNFQGPAYQTRPFTPVLTPEHVAKYTSLYLTGSEKHVKTLLGNLHSSPATKRRHAHAFALEEAVPKKLVPNEFAPPAMNVVDDVPSLRETATWMVSPLLEEDLSRLPPALIVVMEHDVLRDDAYAFHNRLQATATSSNKTRKAPASTLVFYERAYHAITFFPRKLPKSSLGLRIQSETAAWIKKHL